MAFDLSSTNASGSTKTNPRPQAQSPIGRANPGWHKRSKGMKVKHPGRKYCLHRAYYLIFGQGVQGRTTVHMRDVINEKLRNSGTIKASGVVVCFQAFDRTMVYHVQSIGVYPELSKKLDSEYSLTSLLQFVPYIYLQLHRSLSSNLFHHVFPKGNGHIAGFDSLDVGTLRL